MKPANSTQLVLLPCHSLRCAKDGVYYPASPRLLATYCQPQLPASHPSLLLTSPAGGGPLNRWVIKSCEPGLHDQSAMNWLFEGAWHRLPRGYNVQPTLWDMLQCSGMRNGTAEVGVLHYAGPAKPWWKNPMQVPAPMVPLSKSSVKAWRHQCPETPITDRGAKGVTRGGRRPKKSCESWGPVWNKALWG